MPAAADSLSSCQFTVKDTSSGANPGIPCLQQSELGVWARGRTPFVMKFLETAKAMLNKESAEAYWQHCAGEAKKPENELWATLQWPLLACLNESLKELFTRLVVIMRIPISLDMALAPSQKTPCKWQAQEGLTSLKDEHWSERNYSRTHKRYLMLKTTENEKNKRHVKNTQQKKVPIKYYPKLNEIDTTIK